MLSQALRSRPLFHTRLARGLFGFFERKEPRVEHSPAPTTTSVTTYRQVVNQNKQRELTKAEQYFADMKMERELQDDESQRRRREIEEAESIVRKEADVTLRTVDYRAIIVTNQELIPSGEFKSFDDFAATMKRLNIGEIWLTEENLGKILRGFIDYSGQALAEISQMAIFQEFLESLSFSYDLATKHETLLDAARFLDAYCVTRIDCWTNLERVVNTRQDQMPIDALVEIVTHFANQNEGTDMLYDRVEKRLAQELGQLTTVQLVSVITAYFNRRVGQKEFMYDLLNEIICRLESNIVRLKAGELRRLAIVMREVLDIFQKEQKTIYRLIEAHVLEQKASLTFTDCCLLARGFGYEFGSKELFAALDAKSLEDLRAAEFEEVQMYTEGFLFTYRVGPEAFEVLDAKLTAFLPNFGLFEMARIAKAYYMLGKETRPICKVIEQRIIASLYHSWQEIDKEALFEIAHSYAVTRAGSRELYRVLELVFVRRLPELSKFDEYLKGLITLYEESGLCSAELLKRMRRVD